MLGPGAGLFCLLIGGLVAPAAGQPGAGAHRDALQATSALVAFTNEEGAKSSGSGTFEVIVIDWEQHDSAKAVRDAVQLRFPDAKLSLWNSNQGDLRPPFVMVQLRPGRGRRTLNLRLLTHEGAVYTRELKTGPDKKALQERVTRELTSTLLAIAQGLIEPDEQSAPTETEPARAPAPSSANQTAPGQGLGEHAKVAVAPTRAGSQELSLRRQSKPSLKDSDQARWRAWFGILGTGALPWPSFPRYFAGWGLTSGFGRSLGAWDLGAGAQWMMRSKAGARLHRVGVSGSGGQHWMLRSKLRYALMGRAQIEAWWIGALEAGQSALPRPKGSQVLLGAGIEQTLSFRVLRSSRGAFWLGPQLVIGYAGLVGNRFSALGVFLQEPQDRSNALARLGGVEMTLGLRVSFVRHQAQ